MSFLAHLKKGNINITGRKFAIMAAMSIVAIVIVDLLATRQMFPYDNFSGSIIFALNIVIAYGIGSYVVLRYVRKISADMRSKSLFLNSMFWIVVAVQIILLAILTVMAVEFYYYNVSVRYLTYAVFATSTIAATAIMGITAVKFFSWYRLSHKNHLVWLCGMAVISLATAMIFDASAKLLLVRAVEEESPPQAVPYDTFIYRNDEKYQGEVQYKVVKLDTTTLYIVPASIRLLYHYVNGWIPITISFVFTWAITGIFLRQYYQSVGKLPIIYWILIILPIALYMMGRTTDLYTVFTGQIWHWEDFPNPYLLKSIFRAGVIGGSILFGVAFFAISRKLASGRLKDYLTVAAIGAAMIGITLAPSAQQQTFGVAGRSLMLLASFMLGFGFYLSAVSIAQDAKLRESIRFVTGAKVLSSIAAAQLGSQIEKKVLDVAKKERATIEKYTGIQPPLEDDVKQYLDRVLQEVHRGRAGQAA